MNENNFKSHDIQNPYSREELERMFINRPLEHYVVKLSAWVDFMPIINEEYRIYEEKINRAINIITESRELAKLIILLSNNREIKIHGVHLTNIDDISQLIKIITNRLSSNYQELFEYLKSKPDDNTVNIQLTNGIALTILSYNVCITDDSIDKMEVVLSTMEQQINALCNLSKTITYGGINEVIQILSNDGAVFNNQMFKDIYQFCMATNIISDDQISLHNLNSRTNVKIDYIRAAYNRLKKAGVLK